MITNGHTNKHIKWSLDLKTGFLLTPHILEYAIFYNSMKIQFLSFIAAQPERVLIEYPSLFSTASSRGTNCFIAFLISVLLAAHSFQTDFILQIISSWLLSSLFILPLHTLLFTRLNLMDYCPVILEASPLFSRSAGVIVHSKGFDTRLSSVQVHHLGQSNHYVEIHF